MAATGACRAEVLSEGGKMLLLQIKADVWFIDGL